MNSKATLEDAIALAATKHKGQTDKASKPYILHPLRVMFNLGPDASETERIVAILHDVVEDTDITFADLREMGFSEEELAGVDAVTKRPKEKDDYRAAIRRLSVNPVARRVKIADLTDNLDLSRIAHPTPKDHERLDKYREARAFLEGGALDSSY